MKKLIGILSALAMVATMFTSVAMADENNYVKWENIKSTSTTLSADLVFKTNKDIYTTTASFSYLDAKKAGLTGATFVANDKTLTANSAFAKNNIKPQNKFTFLYKDTSKVSPITGEFNLGTLTLTFNEGSTFSLDSVYTAFSALGGHFSDDGADWIDEDYTSEFTNEFFNLKVPATTPTTVTSFTMTPATATVDGEKTQDFTVAIEGSGDGYDAFTYKVVDKDGADVKDATTTVKGNVITFTAPAATDAEQTFTITAESTADSSKTATSTVTVPAKPADPKAEGAGGDMVNPGTGLKEKTYVTGILAVPAGLEDPVVVITDETGKVQEDHNANWYPKAVTGAGTVNVLAIVRYAGDTAKTFTLNLK